MDFTISQVSTREDAILIARQVISRQPVYLDTETTGLNENDEILEIAIITDDGSIKFESLVRPTVLIPLSASRIHGITNLSVKQSPFWNKIWPELNAIFKDKLICAYNSDFDMRMIRQSNFKFKLQWVNNYHFFDIMILFSIFNQEWDPIHQHYRFIGLEKAGNILGIAMPNAHRALADARLARAVLHSIAGIPY